MRHIDKAVQAQVIFTDVDVRLGDFPNLEQSPVELCGSFIFQIALLSVLFRRHRRGNNDLRTTQILVMIVLRPGKPLLYENYGIDSRYTGPHKVAPTLSARMGTGGLNTSLVQQVPEEVICIAGNAIDRQPQNGGNGFGWQRNISYTLTATDRHSVYARQRVDQFRDDEIASTESARQHKDATDLICQPPSTWDADCRNLIRRLTPLECERLQGYPDGWTDVPGASDSARYKALGNSVAIPCVEYLMQRVAMVITLDLEWDF